MDSFVKAFRFLVSNFPMDRITHNQSSVVTKYRDMISEQLQKMLCAQLSLAEDQGSFTGQTGMENMDFVKVHATTEKSEVTGRADNNGSPDLLSSGMEEQKATVPTTTGKKPHVMEPETSRDPYPCMLAVLGSGGVVIKAIIQYIQIVHYSFK